MTITAVPYTSTGEVASHHVEGLSAMRVIVASLALVLLAGCTQSKPIAWTRSSSTEQETKFRRDNYLTFRTSRG